MSVVQAKPITPAELLAMQDGKRFELVNGQLVERNGSVRSSLVEAMLGSLLTTHCMSRKLGVVLSSTNGIQCFPDDPNTVRKPDICFVRRERFSKEHVDEGFLSIAPDLAVEIISPNDLASEVNEKVEDYRAAKIPLVWVIDPEVRTALVFRDDGTVSRLGEKDELDGEAIMPGFRCRVADLFPVLT